MDALELIRQFLTEHTHTDPALLTPDARLADLGIDSFTLLELIFAFEERWQVSIPNDTETPDTVRDLITLVERFRPNQPA
ncbi:acyl carrier protein [Halothiobacillus sp. DCM-1]|uniref:acyl carrier protein n=1 Tax=Halothiobacillus sp. DCM-1 TaxID=3112558 RepID=UPI0032452FA3